MASNTIFDLISLKLNKVLSTDLIPKFSEIATEVVSNFGDEPPSKESMMVLFENAFKQALASPRKKKEKTSSPKAEKPKKEKKASTPKKKSDKKTPVPKPQWLTKQEMENLLEENPGERYFCGFVADRGPNKGKFCACELKEEAKNCGILTEDGWTPHSPSKELEIVEDQNKARCKKCWANGKNGTYRKVGAFDKLYNKVEVESPKPKKKSAKKEKKKEEIPEIPEVPDEVYNQETDTEEVDNKVVIDVSEPENNDDDGDDEDSAEEILDGLLD